MVWTSFLIIYHGECWTHSGFNYCLACFYIYYTLIEHKQGSKFVSHFIADFNVMYQELEQNTPTVTYYVFYHVPSTWIYVIYVIIHVAQYNSFLQMLR